ncbi:MAG: molybdenum cofactor guanylyltransferase [Bryobacterales bacterium]|nr:molybdenum cofactor guanylyltransferase [Bryobacterales bacterium]
MRPANVHVSQCYHDHLNRGVGIDWAGFVLTGGKSTRMGQNKAFLSYSGRTLLERISEAVAAAAGSATLVGDPGIYGQFGLPVLRDRFPESGPLAGIEAALGSTTAEWNLIVAVDMPGVSAEFLSALCQAAGETDCLVPTTLDGRKHPLCAGYHRRCLEPVRAALLRGERKVTAVVESLNVRYWPADELSLIQNVNTPLDWSKFLESQPA